MIARDVIDRVVAKLGGGPVSLESVGMLRDAFDGLHFTHCLEDEITDDVAPVHSAAGYDVYLVDGSGHCMRLTTDADSATGLLVAEREADDAA